MSRDSAFLRRLSYLGAAHGPKWLLRYSPPVVGVTVAALSPSARGAVRRNLRLVRGRTSPIRETLDTLRTFTRFAGCFAESLAAGSKNDEPLEPELVGRENLDEGILGGPFIVGTIHSGGWDVVGSLLSGRLELEVVVVMEKERDAAARALHDEARSRANVRVVHVGDGPLDALPLLSHLRGGGVVAVQLDRIAPGMRALDVELFDAPGKIPEGPFLLSRLTGVPIVPIFCARLGFRRYRLVMLPAERIARNATPEDVAASAQRVADAITRFVREDPTQWFNFGP